MNICVVGGGYVGLTTAVGFALHAHQVTCVEADRDRLESTKRGVPPFVEMGLADALGTTLAEGRLKATGDLEEGLDGAEIVFVCVETPTTLEGDIDLSSLRSAITQIGSSVSFQELSPVVVIKSTVVPSTTESVILPLLRQLAPKAVGLCVVPEFLRQGNALEDVLHPDRVVIGAIDRPSGQKLKALYADFGAPTVVTSAATAEMIKYASNALLATAISFSNEMANICELIPGVDVQEVMTAVHLDRRLSPGTPEGRVRPGFLDYLVAGSGFGGSCLPKDLRALQAFARRRGYEPALLQAVEDINTQRPVRLVNMAQSALGSLEGKRIAVLGLAFKPETDDMRDSPAIPVVEELLHRGATVVAYDPLANDNAQDRWQDMSDFSCAASALEALEMADAALVVTAWQEFAEILPTTFSSLLRQPIVVDGRRILQNGEGLDSRYLGIGRETVEQVLGLSENGPPP